MKKRSNKYCVDERREWSTIYRCFKALTVKNRIVGNDKIVNKVLQ